VVDAQPGKDAVHGNVAEARQLDNAVDVEDRGGACLSVPQRRLHQVRSHEPRHADGDQPHEDIDEPYPPLAQRAAGHAKAAATRRTCR